MKACSWIVTFKMENKKIGDVTLFAKNVDEAIEKSTINHNKILSVVRSPVTKWG